MTALCPSRYPFGGWFPRKDTSVGGKRHVVFVADPFVSVFLVPYRKRGFRGGVEGVNAEFKGRFHFGKHFKTCNPPRLNDHVAGNGAWELPREKREKPAICSNGRIPKADFCGSRIQWGEATRPSRTRRNEFHAKRTITFII